MNRLCIWKIWTICAPFVLLTSFAKAASGLAEYDQPWEICALCHSLDGNSHMAKFPKLAGQRKDYIEKQLNDFLSGYRNNDGGQMSSIVTEIDPADIPRIAQWYSSQQVTSQQALAKSESLAGETLFLRNGCGDCHNGEYKDPSSPNIPLIASQHSAYLIKQLIDFQENHRTHVNNDAIVKTISEFSREELISLSTYLAAKRRR